MREKINKKGFTLVELITTIVILGVIITIAIVSVGRILQKTHKSYDEKQRDLFELAAQEYFTDNKSLLPKINNGTKEIKLSDLIGSKYIGNITNSKGEDCDINKSIVRVTRKGVNKYVYESVLICGKNTKLGDLKEIKKGTATITLYHSGQRYKYTNDTGTGKATIDKLEVTNNTYYYVNSTPISYVEADISDSTGISSYRYEIYRKDSSKNFKLYKSSEQIMLGSVVTSKKGIKIEVDSKTLKDGAYKVKVISINKDGYESKSNYSDVVVIDTKKPRCSIGLSGTEGKINGVKTGWYTKADVKLTIKITDANKYQLKYTNNANDANDVPQQSSYMSFTKTEEKLSLTASNIDGVLYTANVRDKAFNKGSCNNNNKPIRIDTNDPKCSKTELEYKGDGKEVTGDDGNTWTNRDTRAKGTCENSGVSGCYKLNTYTGYVGTDAGTVKEDTLTPPVVYSGAGLKASCSSITYHIDKKGPKCNVSGGSDEWLNIAKSTTKSELDQRVVKATCDDTHGNKSKGVGCAANQSFSHNYPAFGDINTDKAGAKGDGQGGQVEDKLGNSTECKHDKTIRIDRKAPICSVEATYSGTTDVYPNNLRSDTVNSWTKVNVSITNSCNDYSGGSGCSAVSISRTISAPTNNVTKTTAKALSYVSDRAGNESDECPSTTVYHDTQAPINVPMVNVSNENWTNEDVTVSASGGADCANEGTDCVGSNPAYFWYQTNKGINGNASSFTIKANTNNEGIVRIRYVSCDALDNCQSLVDGGTLNHAKIDVSAPIIAACYPANYLSTDPSTGNIQYPYGFNCGVTKGIAKHVIAPYISDEDRSGVKEEQDLAFYIGTESEVVNDSMTHHVGDDRHFCLKAEDYGYNFVDDSTVVAVNVCDNLGNCAWRQTKCNGNPNGLDTKYANKDAWKNANMCTKGQRVYTSNCPDETNCCRKWTCQNSDTAIYWGGRTSASKKNCTGDKDKNAVDMDYNW